MVASALSLSSSLSLSAQSSPRNAALDSTKFVVYSLLDNLPDRAWDDAAASLLEKGIATVRLSATPSDGTRIVPTAAMATGETPQSLEEIHSRAFRSSRLALDDILHRETPETEMDDFECTERACSTLLPMIAPEADSAHATGFHRAGGMSRYNALREGIVFSDTACSCSGDGERSDHERLVFWSDMSGMFWSLHGIADRVLLAIERKLELEGTSMSQSSLSKNPTSNDESHRSGQRSIGWFQQHMGPTDTASQWHMKRFVVGERDEGRENEANNNNNNSKDDEIDRRSHKGILRTEAGDRITLPMHTDPSLVSVIIHDNHGELGERKITTNNNNNQSGKEVKGALGLEYYHPKTKQWEEPEAHGHMVATVFVGSVLAHLTSGKYPACKHRVVEQETTTENGEEQHLPKQRMAATLFVRPQPSALLKVPLPSPWLIQQLEEEERQKENGSSNSNQNRVASKTKNKKKAKPPITFDAWLKRVARNYEKQKRKQKKTTNGKNT